MIPIAYKRVIYVMSRTRSPVPISYIATHAHIVHPLKLLSQMEKEDLIQRAPPSTWSSSNYPLFHLTAKSFTRLLNDPS
jgi:hypothetical protein